MSARVLAIALAGCGRLGFDAELGRGTDASRDTSVDAPACSTFSPWSAPVALTNLNTTFTDYGGQITGDGLTLYFDSNRDGTEDLFVATRPDRASSFGAPQKLIELDTAADEGDASPSPDGLELIFWQGNDNCLRDARRATPTDQWSIPTVTTICPASGAFITNDGLTLYYNTALDANFEGVLSVTTRATTADAFTPGMPIAELGGPNKGYPALTADELTIYFESLNSGTALDIWQATRTSRTATWGAPTPIPEIETSANDGDPSITDDGLEMFLESQGSGNPDIYHATRTCM